jgi:histone deacetylase complex regulatory component SIN3
VFKNIPLLSFLFHNQVAEMAAFDYVMGPVQWILKHKQFAIEIIKQQNLTHSQ